jgi:hypothetical protein
MMVLKLNLPKNKGVESKGTGSYINIKRNAQSLSASRRKTRLAAELNLPAVKTIRQALVNGSKRQA